MPLPASPQPAPGPARPVAVTETGLLGTPVKIQPHGCNSGALLGRLGVLVQALLATVAFSTLMCLFWSNISYRVQQMDQLTIQRMVVQLNGFHSAVGAVKQRDFWKVKRFQEPKEERRPWRIWFYDTSKQAIGALFIHFANVFLSGHTAEDPCSLYLMNFILDATLGMLLIWFGVKVVSWVVEHQKYTCLVFGEYGDPPQAAAWIGQCILYLLIMVFEKTVVSLALFIPGWTKLQEILLDYIPDPQLELVLVMFIVPFTVNAVMFWVVDSLIMRKYKQTDSLEGSRSIENPVRNEESQVLLCPDLDFDRSESD